MTVVGFDFGTTNSLISVVAGDRVVNVTDPVDGRPFPSVVRYEGARVEVGRAAKDSLDASGLGVHGNVVLSPKFLLGDEVVHVGGVERSPIDIVRDVVAHVREQSLTSPQARHLGELDRAVVTIPISMSAPRRAALRDAFRRAGIGIVQFVHEPLAALYGWFRSQPDVGAAVRELHRRNVLVIDWGGGTLDLTLCRIDEGRMIQLRNGGSGELGGDRFDEAIRAAVIARFCEEHGIDAGRGEDQDARLRLLHDSERNKIDLSERQAVTFYRPGLFRDPDVDLELRVARDDLEHMTRKLVQGGINEVTALLESVGIGPSQVSLCLLVGGMAAMPAISSRLYELFGSQRVERPANSATLVAEGAAWLAHDRQRLRLAKPLELQMARGSYTTLLPAGLQMPEEHETKHKDLHLYCTDPRDGVAKFQICTPARPVRSPQRADRREALGTLTVSVDRTAQPFRERLSLAVTIDDDLLFRARAQSAERRDTQELEIHDLEFSVALPGGDPDSGGARDPLPDDDAAEREIGEVTLRANVHEYRDDALVPGELLYETKPLLFDRRRRPPLDQLLIDEHLYYQPCSVCGLSWSDTNCRCASGAAS